MAIIYNEDKKVFNIKSKNTSYALMVADTGHLIHLYWGRKLESNKLDYIFKKYGKGSFLADTDYIDNLHQAVEYLDQMRICGSIYNIPLCLLPKNLHRFATRSISDWKQGYTPVCSGCKLRDECCGVFLTSGQYLSRGNTKETK